jgi:hypothetical protein
MGLNMHQMPNLRPSLRIHAVIAILLCMTLAFVAVTRTEEIAARLFFGFLGVVVTVVLISAYRKETALAHDHMIVVGTITDIMTGRRGGHTIKYRFVALNGSEYTGESDWGARRISMGADVVVLYNPLQPTINQPVTRFLFYSFQPYGSK